MADRSSTGPNSAARRNWLRAFTVVFYLALGIFATLYLQTIDWSGLSTVEFNLGWLALATGFALLARYIFGGLWIFFLHRMQTAEERGVGHRGVAGHAGASVPWSQLMLIYSQAWLGRYIPGAVTWVAGKVLLASRLGISKRRLAVSSFFEIALQLLTVMSSGLLLLLIDDRAGQLGAGFGWLLGAAVAVGLVALLPPVFGRLMRLAARLARREAIAPELVPNAGTLGVGVLGFIASSLVSGLALFFVALSIDPDISLADLIFVVGASNLASAISMLAVFAPAGLGVRDGLQLAALLFVTDPATAVLITVVMRLASIAWDGLFWLVALASHRLARLER